MQTLKHHTIVYDDECPMCDLYTRSFVRAGMLDETGREPFTDAKEILCHIDRDRARDEIALVNDRTGEVYYGVDSLMRIISNSFPIFRPLFRNAVFYWLMKKFYAFISYNRKVIMPARKNQNAQSCIPAFNIPYRVAYIVFSWIVTSWVLNAYVQTLSSFMPSGNFFREFLVCGGQIFFQGLFVIFFHERGVLNYAGNLMTISLGGALALSIPLMLASVIQSPFLFAGWFLIVVGCMLVEHMRRVRILGLSFGLTITWVCYRILVMLIII